MDGPDDTQTQNTEELGELLWRSIKLHVTQYLRLGGAGFLNFGISEILGQIIL